MIIMLFLVCAFFIQRWTVNIENTECGLNCDIIIILSVNKYFIRANVYMFKTYVYCKLYKQGFKIGNSHKLCSMGNSHKLCHKLCTNKVLKWEIVMNCVRNCV